MDFKWISETLTAFKSKQRIFVLIIIAFFTSGTYIVTSSFKKSDCSEYQTEIDAIHKDVERIQANEARLSKTNQDLYILLDSIQNMLIEKRKEDMKSLKQKLTKNVENELKNVNIVQSVKSIETQPTIVYTDDKNKRIATMGIPNQIPEKKETIKVESKNIKEVPKEIKDIQFIDKMLKTINNRK